MPSADEHAAAEFAAWQNHHLSRINARLGELVPPANLPPETLHEAMRYAVLMGGKRLRPLLCLAAYEAHGGESPRDLDDQNRHAAMAVPPESRADAASATSGPFTVSAASNPSVTSFPSDASAASAASAAPAASAVSAASATSAAVAVYGAAPVSFAAALDVACAVELVHAFSLVHDDLPAMDNDDLRRGRLTVHKAFGQAAALLAGDALLALAFGALASALPGARSRLGVALLSQAAGSMGLCGGQMLDMEGEGQPITPDRVRAVDRWKTGSLLAAACEAGALAADADATRRGVMAAFGHHVGAAFQIMDDVLDATGAAGKMGKKTGKDAKANKQTWVAAIGVDAARRLAGGETALAMEKIAALGQKGDRLRGIAGLMLTRSF